MRGERPVTLILNELEMEIIRHLLASGNRLEMSDRVMGEFRDVKYGEYAATWDGLERKWNDIM